MATALRMAQIIGWCKTPGPPHGAMTVTLRSNAAIMSAALRAVSSLGLLIIRHFAMLTWISFLFLVFDPETHYVDLFMYLD